MNGDIKLGKRGMWISLCCSFLILGLSACNSPGTGADDPEPTGTGGESQDVELGQQEQALKKAKCPDEQKVYELRYGHNAIVDTGDVGKGSSYFEWTEEKPALFYIVIEPSGKASNNNIDNLVNINVTGLVATDSEDCPINHIQGVWTLSADIQGTCKDGKVVLTIVEVFENNELTGSCFDPIYLPDQIPAPEMTLTFDLSDSFPRDGITSGQKGGLMYVNYGFHMTPSDLKPSELPLRLVPIP
jgi:hypothetical protein